MTDLRAEVVKAAYYCVANKPLFPYLEHRPFLLYNPTPGHLLYCDCSETSIYCLWRAGAPEPFPSAYNGTGNTESFLGLEHVTDPLPGDFVVYGEGLPLGVQHMATIIGTGPNPLTMSHGDSAEPRFVFAIEGCPPAAQGRITYVRYLPVTPPAPKPPTEEDEMRLVQDPVNHGWWLVHGDRRAGVPNPTALAAQQALGTAVSTLSEAELATLTTVAWGQL